MSTITAQDVNKLRQLTGAGMMDCKKALSESGGDFDGAVELLRKKGQKVSASRQDREATEGGIFAKVSADGKTAAMLELNCETDFVARNEDFQGIATGILEEALSKQAPDLAAVQNLQVKGQKVSDLLTDAMGRIGEKIEVSKYVLIHGEQLSTYIHPGAKVGVLVAFEGAAGVDLAVVGKDISMQIAAMNPQALDKDDLPADVVAKEMEIAKEQVRAQGKPENMLEKIALGMLNKYYKENTLLQQEFVKDPSKTIAQYLKETNPNLKIKAFKRFHLGA
ncbi:MAG: elongation factor Ts [Bacteroidetes bacterium]|nr:elongation factor Ts [Bacteroidota bacterium]